MKECTLELVEMLLGGEITIELPSLEQMVDQEVHCRVLRDFALPRLEGA